MPLTAYPAISQSGRVSTAASLPLSPARLATRLVTYDFHLARKYDQRATFVSTRTYAQRLLRLCHVKRYNRMVPTLWNEDRNLH